MFFKQIYEPGLAHASYMVGCQATGQVMVVDAKRDVDTYIEIARQERLKITHIVETHIHADFLCGSRELQELTDAEILVSDEGGSDWAYTFAHTGLREGSSFMVGNIKIDVMHTPGHTPEHICFLVTDTPASPSVPIMLLSGDFVFVGDVGRPDLLEKAAGVTGSMQIGAAQMWQSLKRFKALPDHIQVHPAHGAGSACGKALGAIPSSTVGYEKLVNWALQHTNEAEFTAELLSGQPEPPTYFAVMKHKNKEQRNVQSFVPVVSVISEQELTDHIAAGGFVIDARSKQAYAAHHYPGTVNIQNNKSFSTWAGWMAPYNEPIALVAHQDAVEELTRKLMRIGLDELYGYFDPSLEASTQMVEQIKEITTDELKSYISSAGALVLDVRAANEYVQGHIPSAVNIHGGHLPHRLQDLPTNKTIIVTCQAGDRSSIAASYLLRNGFTNILNYPPGYAGWKKEH